jgi:hypothetical protein
MFMNGKALDVSSGSEFKALIVDLILNGKVEDALERLAKQYNADLPKIRVGLPRGRRRNSLGCYVAGSHTIYVLDSDALKDPFLILHEFYHHLRTSANMKHRGTEGNANMFAKEFVETYRLVGVAVR